MNILFFSEYFHYFLYKYACQFIKKLCDYGLVVWYKISKTRTMKRLQNILSPLLMLLFAVLLLAWVFYINHKRWVIQVTLPWMQHWFTQDDYAVWGELLVSPYNVESRIINLLMDTNYSLLMREYSVTMREVISVIKNKSMLWTTVKMILEQFTYWWNTKAWDDVNNWLLWSPAEVKSDEHLWTNFVHAKTFVTDTTAVFSTANLWYQWFWRNREYWFVTQDNAIVENLRKLFEKDWQWEKIYPADIHESILFCPVNCRRFLNKAINAATWSIMIQAQYLEDPLLIHQLEKKQDAWVSVSIIVWENQEPGILDWLTTVHEQYEPYLHAKNMLIDDRLLLMWSMNFSTNAIENNREIGIVTSDAAAIAKFKKQFFTDLKKLQ